MSKQRTPWWDKVNAALIPYLGPPPLGPYNEPPVADSASRACPLCALPMAQHDLDRAPGRPTYLRCPSSTS